MTSPQSPTTQLLPTSLESERRVSVMRSPVRSSRRNSFTTTGKPTKHSKTSTARLHSSLSSLPEAEADMKKMSLNRSLNTSMNLDMSVHSLDHYGGNGSYSNVSKNDTGMTLQSIKKSVQRQLQQDKQQQQLLEKQQQRQDQDTTSSSAVFRRRSLSTRSARTTRTADPSLVVVPRTPTKQQTKPRSTSVILKSPARIKQQRKRQRARLHSSLNLARSNSLLSSTDDDDEASVRSAASDLFRRTRRNRQNNSQTQTPSTSRANKRRSSFQVIAAASSSLSGSGSNHSTNSHYSSSQLQHLTRRQANKQRRHSQSKHTKKSAPAAITIGMPKTITPAKLKAQSHKPLRRATRKVVITTSTKQPQQLSTATINSPRRNSTTMNISTVLDPSLMTTGIDNDTSMIITPTNTTPNGTVKHNNSISELKVKASLLFAQDNNVPASSRRRRRQNGNDSSDDSEVETWYPGYQPKLAKPVDKKSKYKAMLATTSKEKDGSKTKEDKKKKGKEKQQPKISIDNSIITPKSPVATTTTITSLSSSYNPVSAARGRLGITTNRQPQPKEVPATPAVMDDSSDEDDIYLDDDDEKVKDKVIDAVAKNNENDVAAAPSGEGLATTIIDSNQAPDNSHDGGVTESQQEKDDDNSTPPNADSQPIDDEGEEIDMSGKSAAGSTTFSPPDKKSESASNSSNWLLLHDDDSMSDMEDDEDDDDKEGGSKELGSNSQHNYISNRYKYCIHGAIDFKPVSKTLVAATMPPVMVDEQDLMFNASFATVDTVPTNNRFVKRGVAGTNLMDDSMLSLYTEGGDGDHCHNQGEEATGGTSVHVDAQMLQSPTTDDKASLNVQSNEVLSAMPSHRYLLVSEPVAQVETIEEEPVMQDAFDTVVPNTDAKTETNNKEALVVSPSDAAVSTATALDVSINTDLVLGDEGNDKTPASLEMSGEEALNQSSTEEADHLQTAPVHVSGETDPNCSASAEDIAPDSKPSLGSCEKDGEQDEIVTGSLNDIGPSDDHSNDAAEAIAPVLADDKINNNPNPIAAEPIANDVVPRSEGETGKMTESPGAKNTTESESATDMVVVSVSADVGAVASNLIADDDSNPPDNEVSIDLVHVTEEAVSDEMVFSGVSVNSDYVLVASGADDNEQSGEKSVVSVLDCDSVEEKSPGQEAFPILTDEQGGVAGTGAVDAPPNPAPVVIANAEFDIVSDAAMEGTREITHEATAMQPALPSEATTSVVPVACSPETGTEEPMEKDTVDRDMGDENLLEASESEEHDSNRIIENRHQDTKTAAAETASTTNDDAPTVLDPESDGATMVNSTPPEASKMSGVASNSKSEEDASAETSEMLGCDKPPSTTKPSERPEREEERLLEGKAKQWAKARRAKFGPSIYLPKEQRRPKNGSKSRKRLSTAAIPPTSFLGEVAAAMNAKKAKEESSGKARTAEKSRRRDDGAASKPRKRDDGTTKPRRKEEDGTYKSSRRRDDEGATKSSRRRDDEGTTKSSRRRDDEGTTKPRRRDEDSAMNSSRRRQGDRAMNSSRRRDDEGTSKDRRRSSVRRSTPSQSTGEPSAQPSPHNTSRSKTPSRRGARSIPPPTSEDDTATEDAPIVQSDDP